MKKLIVVLLTLLICTFAFEVFVYRGPLKGNDYSREFEELAVEGKKNKILDLRDFKPNSWDELVVWFPYSTIGEYKIKSSFWQDDEMINSDDGNNTILFLKHNRVVGWAELSRVEVDFSYLDIGTNRVAREKARFGFGSEEKFTKVLLIEENHK